MQAFSTPRLIFVAFFLLLEIPAILIAFRSREDEKAAIGWLPISGKLLHAQPDGANLSIRYAYRVNGIGYVGERYFVDSNRVGLSAKQDAGRLWGEQKTDGQITIFYDPSRPSRSCLKINQTPAIAWILACSLPLLGAASALFHKPRKGRMRFGLGTTMQ